jgi:hypothetical protein
MTYIYRRRIFDLYNYVLHVLTKFLTDRSSPFTYLKFVSYTVQHSLEVFEANFTLYPSATVP